MLNTNQVYLRISPYLAGHLSTLFQNSEYDEEDIDISQSECLLSDFESDVTPSNKNLPMKSNIVLPSHVKQANIHSHESASQPSYKKEQHSKFHRDIPLYRFGKTDPYTQHKVADTKLIQSSFDLIDRDEPSDVENERGKRQENSSTNWTPPHYSKNSKSYSEDDEEDMSQLESLLPDIESDLSSSNKHPAGKSNVFVVPPQVKRVNINQSHESASQPSYKKENQHSKFHRDLPVYRFWKTEPYTHHEVVDILLDPPAHKVSGAVPCRVQDNCTFIVDIGVLPKQSDITADDNGAYKSGSARSAYIHLTRSGDGNELSYARQSGRATANASDSICYKSVRLKSVRLSSPDLTRWIYRLVNVSTKEYYRYCVVQYYFEDEKHLFEISSFV